MEKEKLSNDERVVVGFEIMAICPKNFDEKKRGDILNIFSVYLTTKMERSLNKQVCK